MVKSKQIKIYDEIYELQDQAQTAIYGYYYKGNLVDDPPQKGKAIGFVQMLDGSTIAIYKSMNLLPFFLILLLLTMAGAGVFVYFFVINPKDASWSPGLSFEAGTPVKEGVDNNLVSYDGFMRASGGNLDINFQNGDQPCTVVVSGDGIQTETIEVQPGELLATVPVTVTSEQGVVEATITISTSTSTATYECVVEIPENNTPASFTEDNSLTGYWRGEYIIGTPVENIPGNE